jgi:putative heme-binding domain-containing protein
VRSQIYRALARLYWREKEWDGDWWQTRPDTTGPYFQPVAWSATPRIADVIRRALESEPPPTVRSLLIDCGANRVDLPEVNQRLLAVDPSDAQLGLALLDTLIRRQELSEPQLTAAKTIMNSAAAEPALRVKMIQVLSWEWAGDAAMEAVVDALGGVAGAESPPPHAELADALESFIQNPQLARRVPLLSRLAGGGTAGRREVATAALLTIIESRVTDEEPRAAAESALAAAWKAPAAAEPMLRAIGRTKAKRYADEVRARLRHSDASVARAAADAARRLGISENENATTTQASETIAKLSYDRALASLLKTSGDARPGKELFASQGCVACHTVSLDEPPKGPFLGGISARYSRTELIESILNPSAKIAQGFETQWFKAAGGDVLEGFVTRDAGDEIELRDANGKTVVLKKDQIKARGTRVKSVMPEGLLGNLAPAEAASLIAYLESLR